MKRVNYKKVKYEQVDIKASLEKVVRKHDEPALLARNESDYVWFWHENQHAYLRGKMVCFPNPCEPSSVCRVIEFQHTDLVSYYTLVFVADVTDTADANYYWVNSECLFDQKPRETYIQPGTVLKDSETGELFVVGFHDDQYTFVSVLASNNGDLFASLDLYPLADDRITELLTIGRLQCIRLSLMQRLRRLFQKRTRRIRNSVTNDIMLFDNKPVTVLPICALPQVPNKHAKED